MILFTVKKINKKKNSKSKYNKCLYSSDDSSHPSKYYLKKKKKIKFQFCLYEELLIPIKMLLLTDDFL